MARVTIDKTWIQTYADRYLQEFKVGKRELEDRLFAEVGPNAVRRGHLTKDELIDIARWKANRSSGHVRKNEPGDVRAITGIAFAQPDERVLTLTSLKGVRVPMASAILAVCFPREHTVYDVRAISSLREAGEIPEARVDYGLYLAACRRLVTGIRAVRGHVSPLRALDRALWKYSSLRAKERNR